jgi:hypothetical protein
VRGRFPSKLHACRVNHEAGFQFSARCDRCSSHRDLANVIAFLLDFRATLSPDCSRYSASELQIVIRGIHDGVYIHLGQVPFDNLYSIG